MRRFVNITLVIVAVLTSWGQTPPLLKHSVASNGDLTLTWPVQVITNSSTNLAASYQLEFCGELGAWTPQGSLLRGASFPNRTGSARMTDVLTRPSSFFRLRTVFDFMGGEFGGRVLQDATLTNFIFTGANFFGASLDGTSFDNANLVAADFRFATMTAVSATNADFTLARLSDADLTSTDLQGAKLVAADLSGAKLTFADLTSADLSGAILQDMDSRFTRFHKTTIDNTTVFDRRSLAIWLIVNGEGANRSYVDVDLSFADLSGGDLRNCNLTGLDLSANDFQNADLRGANLSNANLRLLDLRGTKMDDTTIIASKWRVIWDIINNPQTNRVHTNTDLSLGLFVGTTFERADVRNSNFNLAIMDGVNFENANAQGARFTSIQFAVGNFKNSDLRNATFSNSILEDVNFLGAKTSSSTFLGATFRRTTMPDGTIRN